MPFCASESIANGRGYQQTGPLETLRWFCAWESLLQTGEDINKDHSAPRRVRNKWESTLPKTGLLEKLRPFCTWESLLQMEEDTNKDWSSENRGHSVPGRVYKRKRISTKTGPLERLKPIHAFRALILKHSPTANFPHQWSHWILKCLSMSKVTTSLLFLLKGTHNYSNNAVNCGNT